MVDEERAKDVAERCRIRANIRRNIAHRKSVQEGKPDRIADLFDEAADVIEEALKSMEECGRHWGYEPDPEFG